MEWMFVRPDTSTDAIKLRAEGTNQRMFSVVDSDNIFKGIIFLQDIDACGGVDTAGGVLKALNTRGERFVYVYKDEPLDLAKEKLRHKGLQFMPVIDYTNHYVGTIDKSSA